MTDYLQLDLYKLTFSWGLKSLLVSINIHHAIDTLFLIVFLLKIAFMTWAAFTNWFDIAKCWNLLRKSSWSWQNSTTDSFWCCWLKAKHLFRKFKVLLMFLYFLHFKSFSKKYYQTEDLIKKVLHCRGMAKSNKARWQRLEIGSFGVSIEV